MGKVFTIMSLLSIYRDVSWVGGTPRSPVSLSLDLWALQLKPRLPGLRAPEFVHTLPFGLNPGDAMGTQGIGV